MLETITEAASNFCQEQLGSKETTLHEAKEAEDGALLAYIDIETPQSERYRIYLAAQREFVQYVAKVFLEENESDEETIMDMALESVNLIVGSAKVIASKKGIDFTISTPHLEKIEKFEHLFDEAKQLECEGGTLLIALEKMK